MIGVVARRRIWRRLPGISPRTPAGSAVLVDAPCSGLGVLRRRADARWRIDAAAVERLPAVQTRLLAAAADQVAIGGRLVYSVCTLTSAETTAVAASVYGFAQTTASLGTFLPMTLPGCFSHTSADFIELALPNAGALETDEPLPNDPALQGVSFYHQLVVFELDAQGVCVGVSATNALELTLGVF